MVTLSQNSDNAEYVDKIPSDLSILPLRKTVAYPFTMLPLVVGVPRSIKLIENAIEENRVIGLVAIKDPSIEEPQPGQIYETGTVAKVSGIVRAANNTLQVVVQGLERFRVEHWLDTEPYLCAHIALRPDVVEPGLKLDALQRSLRDLGKEVAALSPNFPDEVANFLDRVDDPRYLAYLVAAYVHLDVEKGQRILEMDDVKDQLHALISHLSHEKEVLSLGQKIQTEAREEMTKAQRDYYLRQRQKAIQKQLGEQTKTSLSSLNTPKKSKTIICMKRLRKRHSAS